MFLIDKKRSSSCIWNVKVRCRFEWASGSRRRVDLYGKVFWSQNYFSLFFHKTYVTLCSNENFVYKKVLFFWIFCEDSAKIRIYAHIFVEVLSWKSWKSSESHSFDTIKWTKYLYSSADTKNRLHCLCEFSIFYANSWVQSWEIQNKYLIFIYRYTWSYLSEWYIKYLECTILEYISCLESSLDCTICTYRVTENPSRDSLADKSIHKILSKCLDQIRMSSELIECPRDL